MDHEVWKLVGGAIALIISMSTVYAIYAKSLNNKKSVKDVTKELEDLRRDVAVLKDQVNRNEKQDEKRDAAIEKLADRVYEQK